MFGLSAVNGHIGFAVKHFRAVCNLDSKVIYPYDSGNPLHIHIFKYIYSNVMDT